MAIDFFFMLSDLLPGGLKQLLHAVKQFKVDRSKLLQTLDDFLALFFHLISFIKLFCELVMKIFSSFKLRHSFKLHIYTPVFLKVLLGLCKNFLFCFKLVLKVSSQLFTALEVLILHFFNLLLDLPLFSFAI